ncbi:MAG: hypothetical protein M3R59_05705 [Verrucomicrobiota bacterium]|nr:hypothetical protein [Verrucomicrobiota bacterium]
MLPHVFAITCTALFLAVTSGFGAAPVNIGLPVTRPIPDLQKWLEENPSVENAIICQFPNITLAYRDWTTAEKKYLADAFASAWRGEPTGLPDPLPNAFHVGDGESRQGLNVQDALQLYFVTVAHSLALELQHKVPWTIVGYTPDELAVLFDSRQFFTLVPAHAGVAALYEFSSEIAGRSLPAPPDVTAAFLRKHFSSTSAQAAVIGLLRWCEGLSHFTGKYEAPNMRAHWQYDGFPPVSRVISGTIYNDGLHPAATQLKHFTAGCWGTTGFLRSVLRIENIPVENARASSHSLPYFPTLGKFLTHGDDPYNRMIRSLLSPDIRALLVDAQRFPVLFGPQGDAPFAKQNVGRRPHEIALEKLPFYLLVEYLDDQAQHKDHASGAVAKSLKFETLANLEAQKLWTRMDARIAEAGGAEAVRAQEKKLEEATSNHQPE